MGSLQSVEKNKRYAFILAEGVGLASWMFLTPWIGIPVMGYGAYLGYKWFQYRVENGMRF